MAVKRYSGRASVKIKADTEYLLIRAKSNSGLSPADQGDLLPGTDSTAWTLSGG